MVRRPLALFLVCALVCLTAGGISQTPKKPTSHKKKAVAPAPASTKLGRINRAFVASADLKPMAQQLLADRTPQGYSAVEAYARKQSSPDAAALAWMVLGYAHYLDKDYAAARSAWQQTSAIEPVVGDYLTWLRAASYQGDNNPAQVIATLESFEQKYPDSLNLHDVQVLYSSALVAGEPQRAVAYLEKRRQPDQPDLQLLLARAYLAADEKSKAKEVFRHLYFELPLSAEADVAATELKSLAEPRPTGGFEQRHMRAEALLKGKRYQDAVSELSLLVEQAPTDKLTDLQLDYGSALYRARRHDDARHVFDNVVRSESSSVDQKAQALYFLAEIARDGNDLTRHAELLGQLRIVAPASQWLQDALYSAANMYMLRGEFDTSIRFYSELYHRQPNGRYASSAHWKSAWLTYRLGKKDEAAQLFDEHLAQYPGSLEVPAALYWRGRTAEDRNDPKLARAYYRKLSESFRHYYYANLGRGRLGKMTSQEITDPSVLDKLPPPAMPPKSWDAPAGNLRAQRAQLLANAALFDFAIKELQAASPGLPPWLAKSEAGVYGDQGSYIRAIETMKRAFPSYFAVEIGQVPRPVWEALFPRPYWDDLKKHSSDHQLDPYLVASLIRQESEFNPTAVSRANAMGLMQLLPHVGKNLAKEAKLHHFSTDDLLTPGVNMQLGTRYFKRTVDHYDGQVAYALAAYNAGENRVAEWRSRGNYRDIEEFVESIPFTETREYVQAILRNTEFYKLLYPAN
ncbi:MAG TPA: transglycosylase SLT domain-containing protein [Candidatus Angelobacter sp.]|nr:transglycosylase SLT domain-containing protein [Candidatus Angelobacter sp.]